MTEKNDNQDTPDGNVEGEFGGAGESLSHEQESNIESIIGRVEDADKTNPEEPVPTQKTKGLPTEDEMVRDGADLIVGGLAIAISAGVQVDIDEPMYQAMDDTAVAYAKLVQKYAPDGIKTFASPEFAAVVSTAQLGGLVYVAKKKQIAQLEEPEKEPEPVKPESVPEKPKKKGIFK